MYAGASCPSSSWQIVHGGIVPGAGERAPFGLFAFAG